MSFGIKVSYIASFLLLVSFCNGHKPKVHPQGGRCIFRVLHECIRQHAGIDCFDDWLHYRSVPGCFLQC